MRSWRRRALNPLFARGMAQSTVREHALDVLLQRRVDHVVLAQAAQTLAGLLLHSVVAARLGATHAAFACHPEALGGGLLRLHLRHDAILVTAPVGPTPSMPARRGPRQRRAGLGCLPEAGGG